MQLKAVFFDKDGVLADSEPIHAEAYVRTFAAFGVCITPAQFRSVVTIGGRRVTNWLRELGGDASDAEIYASKDHWYAELAGPLEKPRPGLLELVADLRAHGVELYVTTGARRITAERLLANFGIRGQFAGILGLEDVSATKPDPEIYRKALIAAGRAPSEAIAVEDMPRGIASASDAGIAVVAVPTDMLEDLDFGSAQLITPSLADLSAEKLDAVLTGYWCGRLPGTE